MNNSALVSSSKTSRLLLSDLKNVWCLCFCIVVFGHEKETGVRRTCSLLVLFKAAPQTSEYRFQLSN